MTFPLRSLSPPTRMLAVRVIRLGRSTRPDMTFPRGLISGRLLQPVVAILDRQVPDHRVVKGKAAEPDAA